MKLKALTEAIYEIVKNPTDPAAIGEEVRLAIENPYVNTVAQKIAARRRFIAILREHKEVLGVVDDNRQSAKGRRNKLLNKDLADDKVKVFAQLIDDSLRSEIRSPDAVRDAREEATYVFFLDQIRNDFRNRLENLLGKPLLPIVIDQAAANSGSDATKAVLEGSPVRTEPRYIPRELIPILKVDDTSRTEAAPVLTLVEDSSAPVIPVKPIGGVRKAKPAEVEQAEQRLRQKGYKI